MDREKLRDIFRLQKKLNDSTNSPSWVFGITKKGNKVNWPRTIHMEVSELIDSRPWKHWKDLNGVADEQNEQVELTDILHFLVSYGIHSFYIKKLYLLEADLIKLATKVINVKDPEIDLPEFDGKEYVFDSDLYNEILSTHKYRNLLLRLENEEIDINETLYNDFYNEIEEELLDLVEKEIKNEYSFKEGTSLVSKYEHMSKYALPASILEEENEKSLEYYIQKEMFFNKIMNVFFTIVNKYVLFNLPGFYFGKNVLNQFRQDNGYKEGTYIKIWNKEEDNVHMLNIVALLGESAEFENIYKELELIYKSLS
jgi:hypothetical protein